MSNPGRSQVQNFSRSLPLFTALKVDRPALDVRVCTICLLLSVFLLLFPVLTKQGSAQDQDDIWEELYTKMADDPIPPEALEAYDCLDITDEIEPDRAVMQYIENVFYEWEEFDAENEKTIQCIFMLHPSPGYLTQWEAWVLLSASSLWEEPVPESSEATTLDASDPRLDLPPAEPPLPPAFELEQESVLGSDERERVTNTTAYPWNNIAFVSNEFPNTRDAH